VRSEGSQTGSILRPTQEGDPKCGELPITDFVMAAEVSEQCSVALSHLPNSERYGYMSVRTRPLSGYVPNFSVFQLQWSSY
jgi:hypothetical protein